MQSFYTKAIQENFAEFGAEESRHLNVLRKKAGDIIHLIDGKGGLFQAEILTLSKKNTSLKILEKTQTDPASFNLHIAIAPTKNIARMEWFLEKATEIGIQKITPIFCERSERKNVRLDRLEKIILSAMKQSKRLYLPQLNEATTFTQFLQNEAQNKDQQLQYIAHCEAGEKVDLWNNYQAQRNVLILIGPEGDFSPKEIKQAEDKGFRSLTLGTARLRTETAAIVACHSIQFIAQINKNEKI